MKGARHIVFLGLLIVLVVQVEKCSAKPCLLFGGGNGGNSLADNIQRALANFGRAITNAFGNPGGNAAAGNNGAGGATGGGSVGPGNPGGNPAAGGATGSGAVGPGGAAGVGGAGGTGGSAGASFAI